ncbi:MAG: hypothetical protein Tsb0013_21250 [Phycisphaerales bacterium]
MSAGARHNPVIGFLRSFTPAGVVPMARRNFAREMTSAMLLPVAVTCVEGNVLSVLIKKGFIPTVAEETGRDPAAYDQLVALVAAAGPLAMLTSVFWTRVFHGRDRVRVINALQICVLAFVGGIMCMPVTEAGLFGLVAMMLLARCCLTGIVTARTDVWRANYPPESRARISGRITMVTSLVFALTTLALGSVIDLGGGDVGAYRYVFALAILTGLGGVWAYGRIRWRGRALHIGRELDEGEGRLDRPGPRAMLGVLKNDAVYRRFMTAQFILGLPNIAAAPIFVIALERTFEVGYTTSLSLVQIIPIVMPLFAIPVWAMLFDRMHIVRYRTYHSWFFVCANALMGVGLLTQQLWVLYIARTLLGIAFGGGMLAWQLGHHDFAKRELASIYMGIHVTLTGVRGLVAPFIGVALFSGLPVWLVSEHAPIALREGMGAWTFLLLAFVGLIGTLLFLRLNLQLRRDGNKRLEPTRQG